MKHHCILVELTSKAAVFEASQLYETGCAGADYRTHPEEGRVFASTAPEILDTISRIGWQVGSTLVVDVDRKGQIKSVKIPSA